MVPSGIPSELSASRNRPNEARRRDLEEGQIGSCGSYIRIRERGDGHVDGLKSKRKARTDRIRNERLTVSELCRQRSLSTFFFCFVLGYGG